MTEPADRNGLVPWVNHLPLGWSWCRLDDVADVIFSNVDKHTRDGETPVRLCNYVDVYKNEKITAAIDFMDASAEPREIVKFQIRRGDILATKDSETPDDIAIPSLVTQDLPGVLCGYHLALIRARSRRVNTDYLAWVYASKPIRAQYEAKAVGVTRFGLSQYAFRETLVPLPPRPEQERIAAYLDARCAAIDAAVDIKRRQIETLDEVVESLIESTVTEGIKPNTPMRRVDKDWIGEIPAHWNTVRIKRLVSRLDYGISQSTAKDGCYSVLKMGHVEGRELRLTNLDFVTEVSEELLVEQGDLLYNRTNSPDLVGKAAVFRGKKSDAITFASYLVRLRMNHRADPYFLNYLINSNRFLAFARKLAIPSVQQSNLNSTRYCRIFVPLPPLNEQRDIRKYLDDKTAELGAVVDVLNKQIETLTAYRKSLIHECVTGQRRISETDIRRIGQDSGLDQALLAEAGV